ncbi:OmpA family protein [Tenacibaculum geojense]|uniref:OmpA family protein n=1 Tax=Tenacibaculum geojense TaxID=915352 RepID=A0ABW3JU25_9FLAO
MKKTLLILIALCNVFITNAQSSQRLERANKYFERAYYNEAIPIYEQVFENKKSFEVIKNLADCHYYVNNLERASDLYKYLIKNYRKLVTEEEYFRYVTTLKAKNKYNNAYKMMHYYYTNSKNEEGLKNLEEATTYLENVKAIGERYQIKNVGINTPNSEFGAIAFGNDIVFSAPKKESSFLDKMYGWNGQHYLDFYSVHKNNIHLGDSIATHFATSLNSKLHEANIIFTKDGKTAYFTRNNLVKGKRKKDSKKVTHLQIYKAQFEDGEWKNITSLPFNSNDYSTEHPALSIDEKTLYFASDMPGSLGSFDIYAVTINNDGSYGKPINLGPTINTKRKEQFPFVSEDNKLYFSSNGHPGFGSLDVFVSTINDTKFSKPDNVGFPVNSGYDDFSFFINSTTKEGFFASNRPGGKGGDDIYQITEQKPLIIKKCKQIIEGTVTDIDTKELLPNTLIVIYENEVELQKTLTDSYGKFNFEVACNSSFTIKASKDGYTKNQKTVSTDKTRNKTNNASLTLKSLEQIAKEEKEALALKKAQEEQLKIENAEKLKLQQKQKTEDVIANEDNIVKEKGQIIVKTEEVNFDYKLWYLRRDTKKAIDKVIDLMKKYPDMIVEIGTHTDIRGNSRYNKELSQKRATSVRMYFMEKGIEPDRISAIGYGETKPLIKCKTEDACTEEQHEVNRRSEFVIKRIF